MSAASFRPATESDVSVLELMHARYEEDGSPTLRRDAAERARR